MSHCPVSATNIIIAEYMALAEYSPERKTMEVRYGRSMLKRLVEEYEQERAFHEWLEQKTGTPCPGCDLRVEKHSGCNHVRFFDYSCHETVVLTRVALDDLQVRTTLLLSLWYKVRPGQPIPTFFDTGPPVLLEVI